MPAVIEGLYVAIVLVMTYFYEQHNPLSLEHGVKENDLVEFLCVFDTSNLLLTSSPYSDLM